MCVWVSVFQPLILNELELSLVKIESQMHCIHLDVFTLKVSSM